MKTRQEIEESLKDIVAPSGSSEVYRLVIDLLLDIRELLEDAKYAQMEEKMRRARESAEMERKNTVVTYSTSEEEGENNK